MTRFRAWLPLLAMAQAASLHAGQRVTLTAADGVQVYGDFYPAAEKSAPYILLFHQAGSNSGEYAPIAPRLVALGFNCLALDQRSGGDMWGRANQTAQRLGHHGEYVDALKDLAAALAWARSQGSSKVIVWGSSYSAALVFLLAAEHGPEVAGVLAFSPDEYLENPRAVRDAAAKISVPVFVTSAKDQAEIKAAGSILAAVSSAQKTQFIPRVAGVHGSSTLRADKNRAGEQENWGAVEAFLKLWR